MSDSKFLRGTLIVTLGTFLVKFLGMIYVFPFHALVGTEGGTLYTYGYIPYTIFLSIATQVCRLLFQNLFPNIMRLAIIKRAGECSAREWL